MMNWNKALELAAEGNLEPDRTVEKTDDEWKELLTDEEFRVARQGGTERAFSSDMCHLFEPGRYACICCDTLLFDSGEKFDSGTGWPSFTQPIKENAIAYESDTTHGMTRVEVTCNACDAHLGHVFPDGPEPSGLRYCINAVSMKKLDADFESPAGSETKLATFGGGCFWCTEAIFQQLRGVVSVTSGYAGGDSADPTYKQVCSGNSGHAEVIQIEYDPNQILFDDLLRVHFGTHDSTTLNQQGADKGTQYRSIVFYRDEEEQETASKFRREMASLLEKKVVTEIAPFETFYAAESDHQNYYNANSGERYCTAVIDPKLGKFLDAFGDLLKTETV